MSPQRNLIFFSLCLCKIGLSRFPYRGIFASFYKVNTFPGRKNKDILFIVLS